MKCLFIGAHPDDLEFGCAGTARRLVKRGGSALFLVLTYGERGGDKETRKAEQEQAAKVLGVEYRNMGFADLGIEANEATIEAVEEIIREYKPNAVFTHSKRDKHPDHISTTAIAEKAAKRAGIPLAYFKSFSTLAFRPIIAVKHGCAAKKKEALNCHKSQIEKYKNRGIDFVELAMPLENEEHFEM